MQIDWDLTVDYLTHILAAYALALPTAWDRENSSRSAGLRTFPLVAVGASGFLLVGKSYLDDPESNARLMQGLIGGLGFLGGGAILKDAGEVRGMATAASIWITGGIGMAVAYDRYEIAVVMSLLSFFTLRMGRRVKKVIHEGDDECCDS